MAKFWVVIVSIAIAACLLLIFVFPDETEEAFQALIGAEEGMLEDIPGVDDEMEVLEKYDGFMKEEYSKLDKEVNKKK